MRRMYGQAKGNEEMAKATNGVLRPVGRFAITETSTCFLSVVYSDHDHGSRDA